MREKKTKQAMKNHCLIMLVICLILFAISNGAAAFNSETIAYNHLQERLALEKGNGTVAKNTSIILAAERTHRIDPLDHFHYYTGGWGYQNGHYLSSVAFSAAPLLATAIVWFGGLGMFLLCSCLCCCCCRKQSYGYSPAAYALSLTFLIVFTMLAIAGCVILYTNQEKFISAVANVLNSLVEKAVDILNNVESVMQALFSAKKATLDKIGLPDELQNQIDRLGQLVNSTAGDPQRVSTASKQAIQMVLSQASLSLDVAAAIMLILVFFGLLFSICGWRFIIYLLVLSAWILVAATFILCGVFLIFRNLVADTCVAMEDYLHNPTANSTLNLQFLPCLDHKTAQETFNTSKETTSGLVIMVNRYINNVTNADLTPEIGPLYHNQSGPLVPLLCDPYNPDMTNRTCDPAEVTFDNFSKEWKKHVCQVSSNGNCETEGRLNPNIYDQLNATANIAFSLYKAGPLMVDLLDCSIVRDTFRDISMEHCPGLRRYSYRTYLGLVIVSSSVMFSCIFWLCYARERRHRKYTKGLNKGYMYG